MEDTWSRCLLPPSLINREECLVFKESGFHNGNVSVLEKNVFLKCVLHNLSLFLLGKSFFLDIAT